jgi:hypothetical protein
MTNDDLKDSWFVFVMLLLIAFCLGGAFESCRRDYGTIHIEVKK